MSAYPFALYFSAPYSESLFLLAAIGAFLEAERGRAMPAAGWGLVAGLARSNGWVLTPALIALLLSRRARGLGLWLSATASAAGTVLFSIYVWSISGDPLGWARAQRAWNRDNNVLGFFTGRFETIRQAGLAGYVRNDPVDAIVIAAVVFAAITAWIAARRLGPAYGIFVIAYLVPALALNIPSVGRMTCVLFPCFLGLATMLTSRQTIALVVTWLPIQLWFATRFFTWQTPY
jgi:hypothetical protein